MKCSPLRIHAIGQPLIVNTGLINQNVPATVFLSMTSATSEQNKPEMVI